MFKSYYAPTLEGTLTGSKVEINTETVGDYPGFDKLYKYDYYYRIDGSITAPYYYSTFIDTVSSKKAMDLTYIIPENSSGYDTKVYKAYFNSSDETSGTVMGPYAIDFIDAVNNLPDVVDRFDTALIEAAIVAYNALEGREDAAYISASLVEKFNKARSEYNVSVVEHKIRQLFDIDNSKYSFDKVKDANAAYLALTEDERIRISNVDVLENKKSDLCAVMGINPDFSKEYEDHFVSDDPVIDEPPVIDDPIDGGDENNGLAVVLIIVGAAVLLAGAAVVAFILLKKKKATVGTSEAENTVESKTEGLISENEEIAEPAADETSAAEAEEEK